MENNLSPKIGQKLTVTCTDIDVLGRGICRWNNCVVIVPGLIVSEQARVSILFRKRGFWVASIIKITSVALHRIEPRCPVFNECGGCTLQHIEYRFQNSLKRSIVINSLKRIGGLTNIAIKHNVSHYPFNYRNKAIIPIKRNEIGELTSGYYQKNTHQIVDIDYCPVLNSEINEIFVFTKSLLSSTTINADPDNNTERVLRHICIRTSVRNKESLIIFISNTSLSQELSSIAVDLREKFPTINGIINNVQPHNTNVIFGTKSEIIHGNGFINENFCSLK